MNQCYGVFMDEQALSRILDNLDTYIYVSDIETDEILFTNRKMREEFSSDGSAVGKTCWQMYHSGAVKRCDYCPVSILNQYPDQHYTWEEHNEEHGRYYRNNDSIITWLDGKKAHLRCFVDITEEKMSQIKLIDAKHIAEGASRSKSDFLSRMSHELRTPLNAIIGMTKIGERSNSLDKALECIGKIEASSKQLLSIINDILDMSKIESNKMTISHDKFNLEKMLIDIADIISVKSDEKRQDFQVHIDMNAPKYFYGDDVRISQVIMNLLSNAVKFTPDWGKINLDIKLLEIKSDTASLLFSVTDTGIGIEPDSVKKLFAPFEQAEGGITRKYGGTGLGLSISKSIVEMMGGEISVTSTPLKGSVFSFTVPLKIHSDEYSHDSAFSNLDITNTRVLMIDDDPAAREYFSKIMRSFNIKSEVFESYTEALTAIEEAQAIGRPYNIMFVDYYMPDKNGIEVAKMVKERYKSSIIIIVSSADKSDLENEIKEADIYRFITKPLFPSKLLDVINQILGVPKKQLINDYKKYDFSNISILLAEDVEINREILYKSLDETGINIVSAENGAKVVEMFEKNPKKYDIVFMDIEMPIMNGYEATKIIRAMELDYAKTVPIIAMTANVFVEDVRKCLDAGMNDHISKPIDFDELTEKIYKYAQNAVISIAPDIAAPKRGSVKVINMDTRADNINSGDYNTGISKIDSKYENGGVTTNKCENGSVTANNTRQGENKMPSDNVLNSELKRYVDCDEALNRLRGNTKVYKTLLKSFAQNTNFEKLKEEIEKGDNEAAAATAHIIKGVTANLSLKAVYEVILTLESQLKNNYDPAKSLETFEEVLKKTLECVDTVLESI
jgi:signal transduction histidine kinase/DNA-binding response OmpR family regulator/HPt (histidine-containing phosphotransfer) domain-containing protein